MRAVPGRLQFKRALSGAWVIDDSYNANPSSMHAAIEVLASLGGRRWLALGDMAELGAFAGHFHPNDACRYLLNLGNLRGGLDNITVVILHIGPWIEPDTAFHALV